MTTNTIAQALAYARAHPKRNNASWAGWCEAFVNRAGNFSQVYAKALYAGNASGPLRGDWANAPAGAIHYWAGVAGNGHVAFSLGGGQLLMASSRVSNLGTGLGTIHFSNYGLPLYRGWTMRHGSETLAGTTTAGGATVPLAPPKEDDMADRGEVLNFRETNDGKVPTASLFFRSPTRGIIGIRNPYELGLLQRYVAISGTKNEFMFPAETAMLNYYLVMPSPGATVFDTAPLVATINAAIAGLGKSIAVDADLTPADIAAISSAVNAEFAKRVAA